MLCYYYTFFSKEIQYNICFAYWKVSEAKKRESERETEGRIRNDNTIVFNTVVANEKLIQLSSIFSVSLEVLILIWALDSKILYAMNVFEDSSGVSS